MRKFLEVSVTWEQVTPESAEQGDAESRGFVIEGRDFPTAECFGEPVSVDMSAREALAEVRARGCTGWANVSSTGASFDPSEAQHTDFRSGADTSYTVHVRGPARLIRAFVRASGVRHG